MSPGTAWQIIQVSPTPVNGTQYPFPPVASGTGPGAGPFGPISVYATYEVDIDASGTGAVTAGNAD